MEKNLNETKMQELGNHIDDSEILVPAGEAENQDKDFEEKMMDSVSECLKKSSFNFKLEGWPAAVAISAVSLSIVAIKLLPRLIKA